jgi:hypothetical protein
MKKVLGIPQTAAKTDSARGMPHEVQGIETPPRPHLKPLQVTAVIRGVKAPLTDMARESLQTAAHEGQ